MRHRAGALAPQIAAAGLQAGLRAGVAAKQRVMRSARGHLGLHARQLGLDRELLGAPREHVIGQREIALARRALIVQGHARALGQAQLAAVDRRLAREHPQQRRLAGTVAPGQRHALAALELEADAAQQRAPGDVLVQV